MAECRSDVAMASSGPHSPSFSTLFGQGQTPKLKSYMLSKLNKEKEAPPPPNSPLSPTSPSFSKPMPPLEPLRDSAEATASSGHVTAAAGGATCPHPKKRPRLSSDDPTLLDAAMPSPFCLPETAFPFASRGDEGAASPPQDTASLASARLQRHLHPEVDASSICPMSPPSFQLPGYNMSNIFTDLPFSPTSVATGSPKAVSEPPSPACVAPPPVAKSPSKEAQAEERKADGDDWLAQNTALDLSQLPHLVIASQYRETTCLQVSPTSPVATQMVGHRPAMPPVGHIQLGGPQSCFQAVAQQRGGFQAVRKARYQSGGPVRTYPLVRPLRPLFPPSGGQPYIPAHLPQPFDMPKHRPRPYHPRPTNLPRIFPPPLKHMQGVGSRQVPADMTPNRAYSRDMQEPPSATNKQLPWLTRDARHENHSSPSPLRSSFENANYPEKPILEWAYEDVIRFIFKAHEDLKLGNNVLDVNFSELSGSTGKDLLNTDVEGFKKFSKGYGEQYYRLFIERRDEERRMELQRQEELHRREELQRQEEERRQSLVSSQQILYKNHQFSPSFEYLSSPNHLSQAPHHLPTTLSRDQGPIMVETSAPYEIRYEAHRPMAMENGLRSGISDALPTASLKTFPLFSASSPPNHYNSVTECLSDPDHSAAEEEEPKPEQPKKRGPGRPRKPENELKKKKKKTGRLWEFIRNLLLDPETCPSMVKWENPDEGIFRFVQAEKVAQKWGERKQNKDMNYEKLSRAMRYYYKGGVFEAVLGRRLVYKFGKNAKNWRPTNPNFTNPPM